MIFWRKIWIDQRNIKRQVFSHIGYDRNDGSVDRSIEPRINIDRENRSPAQGVKKTNKHYSYVERLSLSYSSHELVNTMKRSSRSRILAHPHNEVYQNIKSKRFSRLPRHRKIIPILVLINFERINLRKNLLISLKNS